MKYFKAIKPMVLYSPVRVMCLTACMFFAGIFEGISFALFLPLIQLLTKPGEAATLGAMADGAVRTLGISLSMPLVLTLIFVVFGAKNFFIFMQKWLAAKLCLNYEVRLKKRIVEAFFIAAWPFYFREKIGVWSDSLGQQAKNASEAFKIFTLLALEILNVGVYCVIGFSISPKAFFLCAGMGIFSFWMLRKYIGRSRVIGSEALKIRNDIQSRIIEDYTGLKFIKGNRLENFEKNKLFNFFEQLFGKELKAEKFMAITDTLPDFIMAGVVCCILYISHHYWQVPGEKLLVLVMVLYRMSRRLITIQGYQQRFLFYMPAFEMTQNISSMAEAQKEIPGSAPCPDFNRSISFQNISYSYEKNHFVLDRLSLEINKNQFIGVVGKSGSGKTTLLDLILGLITPTEGVVLLDGKDLREIDIFSWRQRVAYVPQDGMMTHDTIEENIRMNISEASHEDVVAAAKMAYADDFIQKQA